MAGLLATAALGVHAQSVSTGQTLYTKVFVSGTSSCAASACHGTNPASNINNVRLGYAAALTKSAVSGRREMQFLQSQLSDSDYNDLAAYIASKTGDTPSYISVAATPAVTLSGSTLAFGSVTVGQTSTARSVTLSNSGSAALTINGIAASGTGFAATNNCPTSLAAGSSCTISVTFTPTSAASVTGSVAITSNASGSPHGIGLSGTGTAAPVANLGWLGSTSSLAFNSVVGTSSAVQTLTLQNTGTAAATLSAITLGGTNAAEFTRGGSCAAGTLAASGSCTVTLSFLPTSMGSKAATLQVSASDATSPTTISLTGTATAPAVSLSASTIAFGTLTVGQTSAARTVTLSNSGSAALAISGIAASGSGFSATHDCPASLAAGSSCTVSAVFAPTTAVAYSGSVAITSNASGSPHGISLSGTGTATAVASLGWTGSTSLSFSATVGTPSAEQTLTLLNSGSVAGTIGAVTVSGTNAADFVHGGSCGAGVTLSAGASCTVTVGFDPAAAGARSATLQVTSTNAANPATISLAGTAGGSGATSNANVGGGGCSVAASGRPFDPLLLALGGLAALVLGWRRFSQLAEDQDQVPCRNP
jgi:cytochrome c553